MKEKVVAVDLGGTSLRLGIVDSAGRITRRRRLAMKGFTTRDQLYLWLAEAIGGFIEDRPSTREDNPRRRGGHGPQARRAGCDPRGPAAIGIGFAGPSDAERGLIYYAPNVGCMTDLRVGSKLTKLLGLPTFLENDANCAALGEHWRGAGRGARSLFLFTVGTGIGGCFLIDGQVWHGQHGIAGEIGHTIVAAGGPRCNCGKEGCLEALVSATAILRDYRRAAGIAVGTPTELTAKMVFDRARQGDAAARSVVDRSARALGIGIANVFHLLNPELILIGGGVSRAGRMLLGPATEEARRAIFPPLRTALKVKRASLGDDAGLLGAARVAFRRLAGI